MKPNTKILDFKPSVKHKDVVLGLEGKNFYDEEGYYDEPLSYDGISQYVFSKPVIRIKEIKPYGN